MSSSSSAKANVHTARERLPASDADAAIAQLAKQWRLPPRERRTLSRWAREQQLSEVDARHRALWLGVLVVQREQTVPQFVRIGARWLKDRDGRRCKITPLRDLTDAEWSAWWRARCRTWARFLVTQRDTEPPIIAGSDANLVADSSQADGERDEGGLDGRGRAAIDGLYRLASRQQAAMLDQILLHDVDTLSEVDRRLRLAKGQTAVQLRRLRKKYEHELAPRGSM